MSPVPRVQAGDAVTLTHRVDPRMQPRTMIVHHPKRCYLTLERTPQHVNTVCCLCIHRWWTRYVIAVHDWWPAGQPTD